MEITSSYIYDFDIVFKKYKEPGVLLDINNKEYFDAHSFSCSTSLWIPTLSKVIGEQYNALPTAYEFNSELRKMLTSKLEDLVSNNYFISYTASGTDSVISAIHFAKLYTQKKYVIMFDGQYHGKFGSLSGRREVILQHTFYDSSIILYDSIHNKDFSFENFEHFLSLFRGDVAAIIVEPCAIANSGGVFLKQDVFKKLFDVAKSMDILLIVDEVQSGFWRTGNVFSYQGYFGIDPDVIVFGKSIGGGLPLYGVFYKSNLFDNFSLKRGFYSSTFAFNLIAARAALHILENISSYKSIYDYIECKGKIFDEFFSDMKDYNRKGMLISFYLDRLSTKEFLEKGVLLRKIKNRILLTPPLFTSFDVIKEMCNRIKEII